MRGLSAQVGVYYAKNKIAFIHVLCEPVTWIVFPKRVTTKVTIENEVKVLRKIC